MSYLLNPHFREKRVKLSIITLLTLGFIYLFSPFIGPIFLSIIFAFAIEPTLVSFSHKKINRLRYACLFLVFVTILLVSTPFALLSALSYSELNHISTDGVAHSLVYQSFQHLRSFLISSLQSLSQNFKLQSLLHPTALVDQGVDQASTYLSTAIPAFIESLPKLALSFLVFNLSLFLFLFRARTIKALYLKTRILKYRELNYLIYSLQSSCKASLISTVLVGIMHGATFSIGSLIFHVGQPVIIFPLTFICSFLPLLGTFPVTLSLISMSLIAHHPFAAVGFCAIAILSSTLDYWMRVHWMVNESKRIHPVLSLLGLLGAIVHFGLAGVIYGPLFISLAAMIIPKFLQSHKRARSEGLPVRVRPSEAISEAESPEETPPLPPRPAPSHLHKRPWIN